MIALEDIAHRLGGTLAGHQPLSGGVSARVTRIEVAMPDGTVRRVVVREPGSVAWKTSGLTADRELALLAHVLDTGLPVPRPLFLDEHSPPSFFVMEHVEGTRDLPPDGPERLADLLARVHAAPPPEALGLPDREDPITSIGAFLGPPHGALRSHLAEGSITLTPRRTLLHGDYWPGNVLWREGKIVALLDWEDAALGDPLSDVTCGRLELRYILGSTGADSFTRAYARRSQRPLDELAVWDAYVAAAALASMAQWGLPAQLEARMRAEAEASLAEAASRLLI